MRVLMSDNSSNGRKYQQERFDDRYRRVTLYLARDIYTELMYRREMGKISSQTEFINKVLSEYFARNP